MEIALKSRPSPKSIFNMIQLDSLYFSFNLITVLNARIYEMIRDQNFEMGYSILVSSFVESKYLPKRKEHFPSIKTQTKKQVKADQKHGKQKALYKEQDLKPLCEKHFKFPDPLHQKCNMIL
mgnify:CR=1 FL=1